MTHFIAFYAMLLCRNDKHPRKSHSWYFAIVYRINLLNKSYVPYRLVRKFKLSKRSLKSITFLLEIKLILFFLIKYLSGNRTRELLFTLMNAFVNKQTESSLPYIAFCVNFLNDNSLILMTLIYLSLPDIGQQHAKSNLQCAGVFMLSMRKIRLFRSSTAKDCGLLIPSLCIPHNQTEN